VTGAFLNAMGILFGGLFGLTLRRPLPLPTQIFLRSLLGAFTVFSSLYLVWLSIDRPFFSGLKTISIAILAMAIGGLLGRLFRLQKISNRLGRYAGNIITPRASGAPRRAGDGLRACSLLFCTAPLGLVGAVADGMSGYFYLLVIKGVMDGLATLGSVKTLGWTVALSAFPVILYLGSITLASRLYALPFLESHSLNRSDLIDSVDAVAGLVACAVALVIFEVRKVELANYLPGLAVAPLLAWLLGH
jgi:uncharacterized protein